MVQLRVTLPAGALTAGLGLTLSTSFAHSRHVTLGLPLDDAWIHAAFARHLAQLGRWSLFAQSPGGGESSPLWPWLLAPGELGGMGAAPLLALLWGGAAWLLLPGLVGCLASTPRRGRAVAAVAGLCGPLLFGALSGMESLPALTLAVAALVLFGRGHGRAAVWMAGVASLLRPDMALTLGVLAVGEFDQARAEDPGLGRAAVRALRRTAPGLALALIGVVALVAASGGTFPSTLAGRRWISGLPATPDLATLGHGSRTFLLDWCRALDREMGYAFLASMRGGGLVRWAWMFVATTVLVSGLLAVLRDAHRERSRGVARLLVVWVLWSLLFYALVLPDRGHVGRYQPQVYVAVLLLAVEGLGAMARWSVLRAIAAVMALFLAAGVSAGVPRAAEAWSEGVAHLDRVHVRAARELASTAGPDATVAVFDVGAVAYFHDGRLVDLSGLASRDALRAIEAEDTVAYLQAEHVTHVLLPVFADDGVGSLRDRLSLLPQDGVTLVPRVEYDSPPELWGPSFQYAGHAFRRLVLYEILWP